MAPGIPADHRAEELIPPRGRQLLDARIHPPTITTLDAVADMLPATRPAAPLAVREEFQPAADPAVRPARRWRRWQVAVAAAAAGVSAMAGLFAAGLWFAATATGHAIAVGLAVLAITGVVVLLVLLLERESVTVTGFSLRIRR